VYCGIEACGQGFPGLCGRSTIGLRTVLLRCHEQSSTLRHEGGWPRGMRCLPPSEMPAWMGTTIKLGVHQGTAPVVNAVCHALRLSRNEVVERVTLRWRASGNRIARGNLLHRFIDQTMHPHDPHVHAMYTAFARSATGPRRACRQADALRLFCGLATTKSCSCEAGGCAVGHLVLLPL
jgi:hypothetical protein